MKIQLYHPSGRIVSLDIMKGLGILLLLLSHSIPGESLLKTWIFSFHMPLFFWCTGYLIAAKHPDREALRENLGKILGKKAVTILIPYVIFSLLIILYQVLLQLLYSHTVDTAAILNNLIRVIELKGIESLWFLPCLLLAEFLFITLYAYSPKWGIGFMCFVSVVLSFLFNNRLPAGIPGVVIRSTTGFVFICFGALSCAFCQMQIHNRAVSILNSLWICLFSVILGAVLSIINGFAAIGNYTFGFVPFFYISAFLTLHGCMGLCKRAPKLQVVPFFGKNSIVVLCTNNLVIEIFRLLDGTLTGGFFLCHGMVGNILFAVLLAIFEIPVIMIGMRYFPYLFGVFPKRENRMSESEKT